MKHIYRLCLFLGILFSHVQVIAQQPMAPVRFANGDYLPTPNLLNGSFKLSDINTGLYQGRYYVLIQFKQIPTAEQQKQIRLMGITLQGYYAGNGYLASFPAQTNIGALTRLGAASVTVLPAHFKKDQALAGDAMAIGKYQYIAVKYFGDFTAETISPLLQQMGAVPDALNAKMKPDQTLLVHANAATINQIAALPFVSAISLQTIHDQVLNYNSRATHGVDALNSFVGRNLNGAGVTVGVGDDADISTHIDFAGRLISRTPWVPNDHGTHTSGTTAGAGIINIKNRGMAARATVINQFFSDVLFNAPAYITDYNMVTTNNSYYSVEAGCPGEGKYDVLSNYVDLQAGRYRNLLNVIAAGNDGASTCSPYPASYGTVKSGWQTAKDVLTVGALNTQDYSIAYFSSRGPVKDGRIKPEITSGGWAVVSTNANNTYGANFGTSMACPAVTGSAALLYERYRQLNAGADPKAALVKALLCNTAEDLGNAGPDYTFGFGMLNTRRAVEALEGNRYLTGSLGNGGNAIHTITIPANTRRVKVMLYWSDTAAAINAANALVNDLDLTVTEPSSLLHRPLVLNSAPGQVAAVATEGVDHVNNIEQVVIENPAAGNYTINLSGYAVPLGPQEYILTYEIVQNGVTLDYPYGGETWVPGESETIRWSAYGNEANPFTLEYSDNGGSTWSLISNAVPANSRSYAWTVPAGITNQARVRITRNSTALTDQSDFNFTILAQPTLTVTKLCEGAVQMSWNSITGATSYDVLQLVGDSMKVIGNTSATSFVLQGLNKSATAWLGVAAKNGTVSGRRSLSVNIIPNGGTCTQAIFNNDVKIDTILEPISARQFFSNASNANKPVKVQIKNLGTTPVSGPYTLAYSYNGTVVTEVSNVSLAAGGAAVYTFSTPYPAIPAGSVYTFKAWITVTADNNHLNDTAYKIVKFVSNTAITAMPVVEGFETMPVATFNKAELAIGNNQVFDFASNTLLGRARSFVNTGFARSGNKALTLDQSPYNTTTTVDSLTASYNLSNFSAAQLRFDFYYKNHGQAPAAGNYVWIRGSENGAWIPAYDLVANQALLGGWKQALINVNDLLSNATPAQTVTSTFQIRIGQEGYTSTNSANPINDVDDGYTIDDIRLNQVFNDVELQKVVAPGKGGCSLTASTPVSIAVKNYHTAALTNVQVNYQINGGTVVSEIIPSIAANQVLNYTFAQTANLSSFIDYSFKIWIKFPGDTYPDNDTISSYIVHNSPIITVTNTNPYLEGFETNDGFFYSGGTFSSWQWGTPAGTNINKAPNGTKAWVTDLTGNYNDNETSYLYSPCFDLSNLTNPMLSFSHIYDIEQDYDYTWVEYSLDGINWQKLGTNGQGTNWYDNAGANNWRVSNKKWHVASIPVPVTASNIRFRFVLTSDAGVTQEGVGVDDIHVYAKIPIAQAPAGFVASGFTANTPTSTWLLSTVGNQLQGSYAVQAALNAYGQTLGTVAVLPYKNPGSTIRISNGQYYLDRSLVIQMSNTIATPVGVRLYFSDAEANALIAATGCATCGKPADAYELGVTHYNNNGSSDENGVLEDDSAGIFRFIVPEITAIIPYDTGYYAEFKTTAGGEFWLSKASLVPAFNGTCAAGVFSYVAASTGATYQWQVDNGTGYTNVANSTNYSGSTTSTLTLTNIPTSFTGYRFRCVVDGTPGAAITLRFKSVWNGTVNANWLSAANWSCGTVPDQYTDVFIPGGTPFAPTVNASTSVRSITAKTGVNITVTSGAVLEVKGR